MRLDCFAADLPVGQIGAVFFLMIRRSPRATRCPYPALFGARARVGGTRWLAMTAVAWMERSAIRSRSIHLQHCPGFRFAASGLRAVYARCICMHEKEFSVTVIPAIPEGYFCK